jgi:hypothetical protein
VSGASRVGLGIAVGLLCAGCTLLDLSSRIKQDSCKYDAECSILNDPSDPNFDPCKWFACGPQGKCVSGPPDLDHDGYISRICQTDAAHQDCDDSEPNRHPGGTEVCDNLDNDCDGLVDEGVLSQQQTPVLDLSAAAPAADFGYALDTSLAKLAVGTRLATSPSSVAVNVFDTESGSPQLPGNVDFSVGMRPLQPDVLSVALVQPVGTVLGAYSSLAPARIVVGLLNSDSRSLSVDPRVGAFGLRCEAGETCADRGTDPSATETPFSDALSISPGGDGTLVVYARNEDRTADLCSAPAAVAHKPLLANLLTRTAQGLGELTQAAVPIGISTEGGAPAVLALPGLTTNGSAFGWLVAYPADGGDLVISVISFHFDQLQFNQPLLRIAASAGPLHTPQMAARPFTQSTLDHLLIGLVAQRDCGDASRVVFAELDATLNPDASVELRVHKDFIELGGDAGQHAAAISYRNGTQQLDGDRRSWGVAYRDASGVRARLIADNGVPSGEEPYLLMGFAADSGTPAEATAIAPLHAASSWFSVYAYSQPSAALLRSTLVSCSR